MNLLDQAIAAISPSWALQRQRARNALAFYNGWSGASLTRPALAGWRPAATDADADLSVDLPMLRSRSQDLYRNAPLAGAAINSMATHVVGTGLSLQPAIDIEALGWTEEKAEQWKKVLMRRWRLWAESTDCDITRTLNFYLLQDLAFRSMLLSGDAFGLVTGTTIDGRELIAIQLIEADRICNRDNQCDTAQLVSGVQMDRYGAPVAYHICRSHPGSRTQTLGPTEWDVIPAYGRTGRRNVIHLFDRLRPGQTRGVPVLAPVMEHLKQLQRYTDAELQSAVISGAFAMFIKMDPNAFQDLFGESSDDYLNAAKSWDGNFPTGSLSGPGKAVNLLPGESIDSTNPGRPNSAFDPFVQAIVRQIGARLGLPFEVLIKHFTSSYSASRAALLDAWRVFRVRREMLAAQFCQPIYEEWLAWEVANDRITAPGFFTNPDLRAAYCSANWIGDGPGSIDPEKEVRAAERRVALGISTLAAESILHDGVDWETKHAQRTKEVAMRRAAGVDQNEAEQPLNPDAPPRNSATGND
jgi:lambda family phage portal protein